jgi:conjugal transfer ATP-binding protein TraC
MNNSRLAKELERLNLGNFIPVVDRMVDVPYFLLEENAGHVFHL